VDLPTPSMTLPRAEALTDEGEAPVEPHLFVVMECARPLAAGARFSLRDVDEIVVGRAPTRRAVRSGRSLTVGVPDRMMSTKHASFTRAGETWTLRDLGSTNGTWVDGERISTDVDATGVLVELGASLLAVRTLPTPARAVRDLDASLEKTSTLSPAYAASLATLARVMASTLPIVLLGETGTGKEVLAKIIHDSSKRPGPFVAVNCGALPETLVESQLFGHVRGAFSGAARDETGFVRASDRGTLFLDEIGDLRPSSQAALLRVLQEHEVVPVGSTRAIKVDLRVVSATHKPIDSLDAFRADLYARLSGFVHELPALRERRDDLGLLVAALLRELAGDRAENVRIATALGRALHAYAWPMNVRELRHVLAASLAFDEDTLDLARAPVALRAALERRVAPVDAVRDALVASLRKHHGNVSEVARELGRTRMQIHRWMKRYEIDPASFRVR